MFNILFATFQISSQKKNLFLVGK